VWSDYAHGLRTGIRNNSIAYGYSILATVGFGALSSLAGSPSIAQMFLYAVGGGLGFALVELVASRGFRKEMKGERSDVVVLGSAINVISISAGLGVVVAIGSLWRWWVAWLLAPLVATVVYLLVVGFEVAFARRAERAREHS
jgi:hypothetical protein